MTPGAELDERFRELTIAAFHAALRDREITAAELVNWYLERIEAQNHAGAELQAVVTVNPRAREDAAARDEFLATEGRLCGPLHGVPVLVKDQAETAGLRTTFGSILLTGYIPEKDATVVAKLKDAGAVILAKTAMCDFAAGWFSSSSLTDHTKNPYAPERESGGSGAGTAAGVAANLGTGWNRRGHRRIDPDSRRVQQPVRPARHHRADQPCGVLTTGPFPGHSGACGSDRRRPRNDARQHRRL